MRPPTDHLAHDYVTALQSISGIQAELKQDADPRGLDAVVWANVAGKDFTLLLEVKQTIYPRDVYQALHQFQYLQRSLHQPIHETADAVLPVLVAESISAGAQEILKRENVAFYDGGGSLFLSHDGTFLNLVKPPAPAHAKIVRNLYSGARARVLVALLLGKDRWFGIDDISQVASVSVGTASEMLKALEDLEWVRTQGSGPNKERKILNPGGALDSWANHVRGSKQPRLRRYYIPYLDNGNLPVHLDQHLVRNDVRYAFTGEVAAQHWTPYLTHISQIRARCVWSLKAELAMQEMNARIVTEGANFVVIELATEADLLFRERDEQLWYANPIHIYLDLLTAEGRAKDMAQFFREQRILF
jgi:hypothetical protein